MIDFKALSAPFNPALVSWRVGSTTKDKSRGMALAYIDARDVMERLDEVCGPAGWQCRYSHTNGTTVCDIAILCGDVWVWKADGAGATDVEAEKGALSDAFKRAAVRWGIGRYLYHLCTPWVDLEPMGMSFMIKDSEYPRLTASLPRPAGLGAPANNGGPPKTEREEKVEELRKYAETIRAALLVAPDPHTVETIWSEEKDALAELKTFSQKAHAHLVEVAHKAGFKEAA